VRFIGGGLAPYCATLMSGGEVTGGSHLPFAIAAGTLLAAAALLSTVHRDLARADAGQVSQPEHDELDVAEREDALEIGAGIGNET